MNLGLKLVVQESGRDPGGDDPGDGGCWKCGGITDRRAHDNGEKMPLLQQPQYKYQVRQKLYS